MALCKELVVLQCLWSSKIAAHPGLMVLQAFSIIDCSHYWICAHVEKLMHSVFQQQPSMFRKTRGAANPTMVVDVFKVLFKVL